MKNINKLSDEKDYINIIKNIDLSLQINPFAFSSISSFRKKFWTFAKEILNEQKKVKRSDWNTWNNYYDSFKQTTNWETIINPKFEVIDWWINIKTEVWFYESYHSYNWLKNWFWDKKIDFNNSVNYKVLSAWVVMYHKSTNTFYLFKRPKDSQEAPWEIDILWGCMNTKDWVMDWKVYPSLYVKSRMKTKAWIDINPQNLKFLWIQEFRNRWFYNIVYLYELSDEEKNILDNSNKLSKIAWEQIDIDKNQDNPWWAWLSLSLEYLEKNKE